MAVDLHFKRRQSGTLPILFLFPRFPENPGNDTCFCAGNMHVKNEGNALHSRPACSPVSRILLKMEQVRSCVSDDSYTQLHELLVTASDQLLY
jgi:hypothetical protein